MLSMKQAARRPRPPLPSAASGSSSRSLSRSTPSSASASRIASVRPRLVSASTQQPADQKFEREIVNAPPVFLIIALRRREPRRNEPVAGRKRGRDEPVARTGVGVVLADRVSETPLHVVAQRGDDGLMGGLGRVKSVQGDPFATGRGSRQTVLEAAVLSRIGIWRYRAAPAPEVAAPSAAHRTSKVRARFSA